MSDAVRMLTVVLMLSGCESAPPPPPAPVYRSVPTPPQKPATPEVRHRQQIDSQLQQIDRHLKSLQETVIEHENHK